ncbi:MAG: hypothetical protein WDN44_11170 [Sphingomonas sp.]
MMVQPPANQAVNPSVLLARAIEPAGARRRIVQRAHAAQPARGADGAADGGRAARERAGPGAAARPPMVGAAPPPPPAAPEAYIIVLDEVSLTGIGAEGGYFFNVYLNLATPEGGNGQFLVGSIGAFEIASARHHAAMAGMAGHGDTVRLDLPVDDKVAPLLRGHELQELSVSFVRIDADGAPAGAAISIGRFRIEAVPRPAN